MQQEPTVLSALAERAATALRELVEAAESEATRLADEHERVQPPAELFGLARILERWATRLREERP
jgi:hypothetical protein